MTVTDRSKNTNDIKLGDKISRGQVNKDGFVIGHPKHKIRDYRVIGLNPNLKLQEIISKNGEEEVGKTEEFSWNISKLLRPMFPKSHLVYLLVDDHDWSYIWVGDF